MKKIILFLFAFFLLVNTVSAAENASVVLHGEKTDVVLGEDIILKLSAVNIITEPMMTVQVILIPPSGMSVTSSDFVTSGAGQFTSTFNLNPGAGKDIEVRIKTNQAGDFNVTGRVIYYFGDDKSTKEDFSLTLPIMVRAIPPTLAPTPIPPIVVFPEFGKNTWNFIGIIALILIIVAIYVAGTAFERQRKIKEDNDDIQTWKNWKQAVAETKKDEPDENEGFINDIESSQANSAKGGIQVHIKNSFVKNSNIGGRKLK